MWWEKAVFERSFDEWKVITKRLIDLDEREKEGIQPKNPDYRRELLIGKMFFERRMTIYCINNVSINSLINTLSQ